MALSTSMKHVKFPNLPSTGLGQILSKKTSKIFLKEQINTEKYGDSFISTGALFLVHGTVPRVEKYWSQCLDLISTKATRKLEATRKLWSRRRTKQSVLENTMTHRISAKRTGRPCHRPRRRDEAVIQIISEEENNPILVGGRVFANCYCRPC